MIKNDEKKMMIKDDKKKITTTYDLRLKDLIVTLRKKSALRCNSTSHLVIGSKFSTNEKQTKTNRARSFPRFEQITSCMHLLGILNGSLRCFLLLRLVGVTTLILVFRQSFENRSNLIQLL